jgi:ABC-type multidrug transport system ATPase subunit
MISATNVECRLSKDFLLKKFSLEVNQGERIAIIGPNGSGKSTLLYLLAGMRKPSSGSLKINVSSEHIGFLSDQLEFPGHWTLNRCFEQAVAMKGGSPTASPLGPAGKTKFCNASKGMRVHASLQAILLLNPTLLFCDEPSSGLDAPHQQILLTTLRNFQGTLLMTTHYYQELRKLNWDRVLFVGNGQVRQIPYPASLEEWESLFI